MARNIEEEIISLAGRLSIDECIKYRFYALKKMVTIIVSQSMGCGECDENIRETIDTVRNLTHLSRVSKRFQKRYIRSLKRTAQHLSAVHGYSLEM